MRLALPLLFILLVSAVIVFVHDGAAVMGDDPDLSLPVYSACTADSGCTLVSLPCGAVAAARSDRRKELQHYYDDVKTHIRCGRLEEPQMLRAVCRESRCAALPPDNEEN